MRGKPENKELQNFASSVLSFQRLAKRKSGFSSFRCRREVKAEEPHVLASFPLRYFEDEGTFLAKTNLIGLETDVSML